MSDKPDQPKLSIVSEQSEREIKTNAAANHLSHALVELAANILRVTRGAGRPHSIGRECFEVVDALQSYREAAGLWPPSELVAEALRFTRSDRAREMSDQARAQQRAIEQVARGGMQYAASRMLGQSTQVSAGQTEIFAGIRAIERADEVMRVHVQKLPKDWLQKEIKRRKSARARPRKKKPPDVDL